MKNLVKAAIAASLVGLLTAGSASAASWEEQLAAGRKEGSLTVIGPVSPEARKLLTEAFPKETGIQLSYEGLEPQVVPPRIEREAAASSLTVDVLIGGSAELNSLLPKGLLAPIKPILTLPEVTDASKWQNGHLEFTDPQGEYMLRTVSGVYGGMVINTANLPPSKLKTTADLLKPEFKGKIVSSPVTSGSGSGFAANVLYRLKEDMFNKIYKGQDVAFIPNSRGVVEQVARGTYLVGFGVFPFEIEEFKKAGFPMDIVYLDDLPGYLSASNGTVKIIKNGPHPNAAAVFVNWFASRATQQRWMEIMLDPSRRTDVDTSKVPSYMVVRPGIDYLDQHQYDFYTKYRPQVTKQVQELIGR